MQAFRKLAKNIFFKIVLVIVGLSFVLFGVSGFIFGTPNSWTLKIGSEKIGLKYFEKAMDLDRRIIRSMKGSTPEIENYISSEKFKSDVANRLIRKILIQKISNEIGAFGSKNLILKTVAEDVNFQDKDGKFDHDKFTKFLKSNGLDEERYIQEVSNEVSAQMIIQTISMATPVNFKNALEQEEFNQEKRVADVFVIAKDNVPNIVAPSDDEISKFYNDNKAKFKTKELREVAFLEIDSNKIIEDVELLPEEAQTYYNNNKSIFTIEESKDFYHMIFEEEESAIDFLKKLNTGLSPDKSNLKDNFVKVSSDFKKTLKDINLQRITKNALPPEISPLISSLKINQVSEIVKSKLGFHIFLLNNINPSKEIPFAEVKNKISEKLIAEKKSKALELNLAKINDALIVAKSLNEVATKYNLKVSRLNSAIDIDSKDSSGNEVVAVKSLKDFSKNAFTLKQNQPSKTFASNDESKFYAIEVSKIIAGREQELGEVKNSISNQLLEQKRVAELGKFAQKIQKEINENPAQAFAIASRNGLKVERNKTFPRVFYIDLGSSKMPYKSQFLDELFNAKINGITSAVPASQSEYFVGIVRNVKKAQLSSDELVQAKTKAVETFANDIMTEYNEYLQKKYPIEVNEKFFGKKS